MHKTVDKGANSYYQVFEWQGFLMLYPFSAFLILKNIAVPCGCRLSCPVSVCNLGSPCNLASFFWECLTWLLEFFGSLKLFYKHMVQNALCLSSCCQPGKFVQLIPLFAVSATFYVIDQGCASWICGEHCLDSLPRGFSVLTESFAKDITALFLHICSRFQM